MSEIERLRALLAEASASNDRAFKAVVDLCSGRLRWEMRVPAEPDHDPDLIISTALRDATVLAAEMPALLDVAAAARAYLASDGSGIRAKGRWSAPFDAMDHAHALGRLRKALARLDGSS